MTVLKYEEVEKLIEENGGFMDQMRVNLSKLERRSLRRMMFTSVAAAVVAAAALMGCIYLTAKAREGERQARAAAAEAMAEQELGHADKIKTAARRMLDRARNEKAESAPILEEMWASMVESQEEMACTIRMRIKQVRS